MVNNTPDTPKNNHSNGGNSGNNKTSHGSTTTGTRRKRQPRRDGKSGSNARSSHKKKGVTDTSNATESQLVQTSTSNGTEIVTDTGNSDDHIDTALNEAALAEGGIKAIGDKRVIPFMKIERPMAIFSIIIVLVSLGALFINGLNLGLDFTGGVSANVTYEQPVAQEAVIDTLAKAGFEDAVVQYLGNSTELLVRLPPQSDSVDGLNEHLNQALDLTNNNASISSVSIIGSQVGNEIYFNSVIAIVVALGMMLLYVAVRFEFKLAIGALLALFHDAIVTLGIFALFQFPFDLTVLAAILALIGYSLNDTIVVYDRIRENFRRVRGASPKQILDLALTETLRRTIMTVSTVFLVVFAMLFLGGDGLYWFSVALFFGLIAGTYSSIYIASSIPLAMGLSRDDFVVKIKPEFEEEIVSFNDPKAFDSEQF